MRQPSSLEWDTVIPPSSLLVFWPGDTPPLAEEVRVRLADWGHATAAAESSAAEGTLWSFWCELVDRPLSYLVWCEPAPTSHFAAMDRRGGERDRSVEEARRLPWVVGLEAPLSLQQPAKDYQFQLRLCEAISRGESPGVYDANAFAFHSHRDMAHLSGSETSPGNASLFSIHKLRQYGADSREPVYWLHTHGLERAGIPDLELFDVPARLAPSACELFEAVADLWIDTSTPAPESPFSVGRDLQGAWRPWQAVASELDSDAVGGWRHRNEDHGHTGYRAVLVSSGAGGWLRRGWKPPITVLEQLTRSQTTLYRSPSETDRRSSLARERWGSFGMLFAGRHPGDWRFAVKLRYPMQENPQRGEHLWYEVSALKPDRIQGALVSQPAFLHDQTPGQTAWHDLEKLSDWCIVTPHGVFDPINAERLFEMAQGA